MKLLSAAIETLSHAQAVWDNSAVLLGSQGDAKDVDAAVGRNDSRHCRATVSDSVGYMVATVDRTRSL